MQQQTNRQRIKLLLKSVKYFLAFGYLILLISAIRFMYNMMSGATDLLQTITALLYCLSWLVFLIITGITVYIFISSTKS